MALETYITLNYNCSNNNKKIVRVPTGSLWREISAGHGLQSNIFLKLALFSEIFV